MNIQQFCSGAGDVRPYLEQPFSFGEWTYATDGHVAVRVPRLPDVPELDLAKYPGLAEKKFPETAEALFKEIPSEGYSPLAIAFPETDDEECDSCDGRGTEHECPTCECKCDDCMGTGHPRRGDGFTVGICGGTFVGTKIAQIQTLPEARLALASKGFAAGNGTRLGYFRFVGGEGVLTQIRGKNANHIDADKMSEPADNEKS